MKTLKLLFGLALLGTAVYVGWNLLPPYFNNYKLQDVLADEARVNSYSTKNEEQIRDEVIQKAKDLDVNLAPEQVSVNRISGGMTIDVNYSIHVDFPIHPVDLNFQTSTKNKSF